MKKNNSKSSNTKNNHHKDGGKNFRVTNARMSGDSMAGVARRVQAPLTGSTQNRMGTPSMTQNGSSIRIKFRELIKANLSGPIAVSTFQRVQTIDVNPGLVASFPWLSTIARNYDQYAVNSCCYEYVNAAPATKQAMVYMVPDYDVTDAPPASALEAMNQMGSISTPVWIGCKMALRIPAAMSIGPRRFIRQGVTNRSLILTDVAKVHVFISDTINTDAIAGQIWVDYDITFFAPQMIPAIRTTPGLSVFTGNTDTTTITSVPTIVKFGNPEYGQNGMEAVPVVDYAKWGLPKGAPAFLLNLTGRLISESFGFTQNSEMIVDLVREVYEGANIVDTTIVDTSLKLVSVEGSSTGSYQGDFHANVMLSDDNRAITAVGGSIASFVASMIVYYIQISINSNGNTNWSRAQRHMRVTNA